MNVFRGLRWPLLVASVALLLTGGADRWAFSAPGPAHYYRELAGTERGFVQRAASQKHRLFSSFPELQPKVQPRTESKRPESSLLAAIEGPMSVTSKPGGGKVLGQMPAGSPFYGIPLKAWVLERSKNNKFGRVPIPYSGTRTTGWISLKGLELKHTPYAVSADLSRHLVVVERRGKRVARFPAATGSSSSPTPPGRYFVTDRVAFSAGSPLGEYAFGLSGIQPNLPAGWSGGNQLAIHGTTDPSSIGTSASAGCLRVSSEALGKLKPLLKLGTPVTINP